MHLMTCDGILLPLLLTKNQLMLTTLHFPSSGKGRLERNPPQRMTFHTLKVQSANSPAVMLADPIWGGQS